MLGPWKKSYDQPRQHIKSRNITLPTKVRLVKAMVLPVVIYVKVKSLSHVWLSATLWTAAYQAPPSMGFSRQEYWSGVPLPSPVWSREGPYWRDLWAWLLPLGMACNLKSTKFYKVVPRIPRQQAEEALQQQIQDTSKEKERQPREKSWESE